MQMDGKLELKVTPLLSDLHLFPFIRKSICNSDG